MNGYSQIVELNGEKYLVQGQANDPINMHRNIKDLLECERDNITAQIGGNK